MREKSPVVPETQRYTKYTRCINAPLPLAGPAGKQMNHSLVIGIIITIKRYVIFSYHQAKTTWNSTEQDVLAARQQVAALDRK